MEDSILNDIKKLLGLDDEYDVFDTDIIIHINSVFMVLNQLGVGPEDCFSITGENEKWSDFIDDSMNFQAVKSYIYIRVKKLFDPPTSSFVLEALNNMEKEYEWRLNIQAEGGSNNAGSDAGEGS